MRTETENGGLLKGYREELARIAERHARTDGDHATAVPDLRIFRASRASEPIHTVYNPALCIVAQGAKTVALGQETHRYDPTNYLVVSVRLPVTGQVVLASPETPFLALQLAIDPRQTAEIIGEAGPLPDSDSHAGRGLSVARMNDGLLDAVIRLVRLLDAPADIPVLAPLAIREIIYRVLQDGQGSAIRQFVTAGTRAHRIAQAIGMIHRDFDKPLRIERLAEAAHMSVSSLHHYFKEATAMSPLQYQKQIRLREARRLLLLETAEAAEAAFRVGYESPSQFSREYARLFGLPPISDIRRLRDGLGAAAE